MVTDLRQRLRDRLTELDEWQDRMAVEYCGATYSIWRRRIRQSGERELILRSQRGGQSRAYPGHCLPRLDDPATVGVLAELVRRRAPDADLHTGVITAHRRAGHPPGDSAGLAYLAVTDSEVSE